MTAIAAPAPEEFRGQHFHEGVSGFFARAIQEAKPKGTRGLALFRDQIAEMLAQGFTRRQVYRLCVQPRFEIAESSFYRWVRAFISRERIAALVDRLMVPTAPASPEPVVVRSAVAEARPVAAVPAAAPVVERASHAHASMDGVRPSGAGPDSNARPESTQPSAAAHVAAGADEKPWLKRRGQVEALLAKWEADTPQSRAQAEAAVLQRILAEKEARDVEAARQTKDGVAAVSQAQHETESVLCRGVVRPLAGAKGP